MIDETAPEKGVQELRYIDPRKIRKIREKKTDKQKINVKQAGMPPQVDSAYNEYFLYAPRGLTTQNQGIKIAVDSICHVTSGVTDQKGRLVLGHLHKAVKPLNQLRMLEDATVIYLSLIHI